MFLLGLEMRKKRILWINIDQLIILIFQKLTKTVQSLVFCLLLNICFVMLNFVKFLT